MKLRWTILGLLLLSFLGLILVLSFSLQTALAPHFQREEQRTANLNLQYALSSIEAEQRVLVDDAVELSRAASSSSDPAAGLLDRYLAAEVDLDLAVVAGQDGKILTGRLRLPDGTLKVLPVEQRVMLQGSLMEPTSAVTLLRSDDGPILIGSVSIPVEKNSLSTGGTVWVGRYIDQDMLANPNASTSLSLELRGVADSDLPADFQNAASLLTANRPTLFTPVNDLRLDSWQLLPDLSGQNAYILRIEQSRPAYYSSRLVLRYIYILLIAGVVLFGLISLIALDRLVLQRVQQLGGELHRIGERGDPRERVTVRRQDELTRLASDINQMLSGLEEAERNRRMSEERLRLVIESMDDMVFTVNQPPTQFLFYGQKARSFAIPDEIPLPSGILLGGDPLRNFDELETKLIMNLDTLDLHVRSLRQALDGQHLNFEWSADSDAETLHFQTVLSPLSAKDGTVQGVVGVNRDITDLKLLEAELRQRVSDLAALNHAAQVYLSQLNPTAILRESCTLAVSGFGMAAAWIAQLNEVSGALEPVAVNGFNLYDLSPLPMESTHPAAMALSSGQPQIYRARSAAETERAVLNPCEQPFAGILALPFQSEVGKYVLVVYHRQEAIFNPARVQLFTALTNLIAIALENSSLFGQVSGDQERLHTLSQRLVEVQEEEKRSIALELHDEIGQLLTGLKLQLDTLPAPAEKMAADRLVRSRQLVEDLIKKVRNLSLDLRPSMLDDLGLLPALLWHFDRYTALTGLKVDFSHSGIEDQRFEAAVELTAYRVIQEALTNVARYAGVEEATVRVFSTSGLLTIQVEDRGSGFDVNQTTGGVRSRGLAGIAERVAFVGGRLTIDSVEGWGTTLLVELPAEIIHGEQ